MNTIAALREGDLQVFEQVFSEYHAKLYYHLLSKTRCRYVAEEAVQLTFIKLWQFRKCLNEEISFSIQLFRIAQTSLIDLLRKEKRWLRDTRAVIGRRPPGHSNEIEENTDSNELAEMIQREIWQMPAMRRKIFEMNRSAGMSYKQIAQELSVSVKAVERHISRALKQLQHLISIIVFFSLFL